MKRILITLLLITSIVYAQKVPPVDQVDKNKPIDIYYKGQYIESMTMERWEAAWQMLDNYTKLKAIEDTLKKENKNVGRIDVELQDSIWNITNSKKFTTYALIKWKDENEKVLKQMKIKVEIYKDRNPGDPWYMFVLDTYVTIIAPIGCVTFGISTLLLLLLL